VNHANSCAMSLRSTAFWGLSPATLLRELAANLAMGIAPIRRRRLQGLRTGDSRVEREAAKISAEFDFLRDSAGPLQGRTVLEIGPGDALGLAPLFISAGAAQYIALDRFLGDVWGARAQSLYERVQSLRGPFSARWRERVTLLRASIELDQPLPEVDLIVSFDVIEHLADLPLAVHNMRRMLRPNGRMVHRIDYGPHGVWLSARDPLSFLRVPRWLWAAIGSNRGYPNRVRHGQFTELLRREGLIIAERITRSHGQHVLDAEVLCGFDRTATLGQPFRLDGTGTSGESAC